MKAGKNTWIIVVVVVVAIGAAIWFFSKKQADEVLAAVTIPGGAVQGDGSKLTQFKRA